MLPLKLHDQALGVNQVAIKYWRSDEQNSRTATCSIIMIISPDGLQLA